MPKTDSFQVIVLDTHYDVVLYINRLKGLKMRDEPRMPKFFNENFIREIRENRWGIILGIIVAIVGAISLFFEPSTLILFLIFSVQAVTIVIISVMFSTIINRDRKKTIISAAEEALVLIEEKEYIKSMTDILNNSIEEKYNKISRESDNLFQIFKLNDGGNFNAAHNIFFRILIESYYANGEDRKYYIPLDTYYKVIEEIIKIGYKLKTINGLLLPFWYVPIENDKALSDYMDFCKKKTESYKRITYYQDYDNDSWKDNTVFMIYHDLLSSERRDDIAVRWLITLIAKISKLKDEFGSKIEKILGIELEKDHDYLAYNTNTRPVEAAIKKNINKVNKFLGDADVETSVSYKMTAIVKDLFLNDMKGGINKFEKRSIIDNKFNSVFKNERNIDNVTEVVYFYKDKENKEYDQFVMFLNGSNTGPGVEIEIITKEAEIIKIQQILNELFQKKEDDNVKTKKGARFRLISGIDVTEKDLMDALLLDSKVYDEIEEDGQFNIEKCMAWHDINPDIYFVLRDEESNDLVGYVNLAPITEACYNRIATGTIMDISIDEESVLPYVAPGLYHLNFTSIAIDPNYRGSIAFSQLMNAVVSKIIELFERGVYFQAMIADAVTPYGEKICSTVFGMDLLTVSNHNSKIYSFTFIPPNFKKRSPLFKALAAKYENLDLNELKDIDPL